MTNYDTEDIHIHPDDKSTTVMKEATNCCGGHHQTIAGALLKSDEWKAWEKQVAKNFREGDGPTFDVDETRVLGHMSDEHFQAFIEFVKEDEV